MENRINIVIPMAGAGSRFQVAGYDVPKPFIVFNGKMMIEHVLESFAQVKANLILVIQEKFKTEQAQQLEKLKKAHDLEFVTVPGLTMGAACTCMAAHNKINNDNGVLFADSDNIFAPQVIKAFIEDVQKRNLDGALLTFNSSEPCFSYAKIKEDGFLVQTKEKEVISNNAICGVYYFKRGADFIGAAIDLVVAQDLQKGEFFMSNVYNHFLKYNKKVGIFNIAQDDFKCVGTPQQLDNFINSAQ